MTNRNREKLKLKLEMKRMSLVMTLVQHRTLLEMTMRTKKLGDPEETRVSICVSSAKINPEDVT